MPVRVHIRTLIQSGEIFNNYHYDDDFNVLGIEVALVSRSSKLLHEKKPNIMPHTQYKQQSTNQSLFVYSIVANVCPLDRRSGSTKLNLKTHLTSKSIGVIPSHSIPSTTSQTSIRNHKTRIHSTATSSHKNIRTYNTDRKIDK